MSRAEEIASASRGAETSTVARSPCAGCGALLDEQVTGCRRVEDGWLCDDCYFYKLGELVEQYPIRS
jgi:predicted RNA-binding Zn-ribbon protein involved in translation (DUF1610 family)